ncbi:MAG: response regulator transcription factor [Synechococcales cyanobacterium]
MSRILIVEDEPRIVSFLEKGLRAQGYSTQVAASVAEARPWASGEMIDLMLLDLTLPGEDGLALLAEVRGRGETLPVIILSARTDLTDKVAGLDSGANDYLTKPFRFEELLARVRVQLRQSRPHPTQPQLTHLCVEGLWLNLLTRKVEVDGRELELSTREFTLLEVFLRHPGQVLSREQLLSHVWGYDFDPGSNVVDVHIRNLRQKIGSQRIQTVRGMGYRLESASLLAGAAS